MTSSSSSGEPVTSTTDTSTGDPVVPIDLGLTIAGTEVIFDAARCAG